MTSPHQIRIRLRDARKIAQISQADLSGRSGIAASAISHFESGVRRPSAGNIVRLCRALGISSDYLLGLTDKPYANDQQQDHYLRRMSSLPIEYRDLVTDFAEMLAERKGRTHNTNCLLYTSPSPRD